MRKFLIEQALKHKAEADKDAKKAAHWLIIIVGVSAILITILLCSCREAEPKTPCDEYLLQRRVIQNKYAHTDKDKQDKREELTTLDTMISKFCICDSLNKK